MLLCNPGYSVPGLTLYVLPLKNHLEIKPFVNPDPGLQTKLPCVKPPWLPITKRFPVVTFTLAFVNSKLDFILVTGTFQTTFEAAVAVLLISN